MKAKKRKIKNRRIAICAYCTFLISGAIVISVLYLICRPSTRLYTLSILGACWLFTIWELWITPKH